MSYWFLLIPILFFTLSLILFPKLIAFANQKEIVDKATGRKRHLGSVPPIGGWLIYAAFFVAHFALFPFTFFNISLFVGVSLLFLLGFIDDKYPMDAKQKFTGQFLAAGIIVFVGQFHFAEYMNMYGIPIFLGQLFCVVSIVFIINAFNLVDGINGLAALLGIAAFISFCLWMYFAARYDYVFFSLTLIAALLVFLRFNLFETKVFLGDNGSMLIGLLASYLAIVFINTYTVFESITMNKCDAEIGVVFATLAIPIADTLRLFIIRPYYLKKSPFKADRNHVHHLLLRLGFNHAEAALLLFGFAIFLVMVSLAAQDLGSVAVILITLFLCIAFLMSIDFFVFNKFKRRIDKKTMFNSFRNLSKELNYPVFVEYAFAISFFLLAVAIPFHRVSTSIPTIVILFSFFMLVIRNMIVYKSKGWEIIWRKFTLLIKQPYSLLLLLLLFIISLNIIFVSYTHWTKILLYLLPLIYWFTLAQLERIIEIKPRVLLSAYIIGLFGFGLFIITQAFVDFPEKGWDGFFYQNLLNHVLANPITHSLYYNIGILFIGNNYKYLKNEGWRMVFWALLAFFVLMIILCSSKVGFLVLPMVLSFTLFNMIKVKQTALITVLSIFLLYIFIAYQYGALSIDYIAAVFESRIIVWREALVLIQENWIIGVGLGNSSDFLSKQFDTIQYAYGVSKEFNALNQFLDTFIELGIFGFTALLSLFTYLFYQAIKQKNKLHFFYLLIIIIYMMFESLFQTQMGMVAFAFFNALFLATFFHQKKTS